MTNVNQKTDLFKSEIKSETKSDLSFKLITITPQIAREWLDSSDLSLQRKLNWHHVMYLAKEMKSGNWDINGEPIQVDKKGNVVNGQHRLNAAIESQCSFTTLVVFGVDTKAIYTIDSGQKPRGLNAILQITYPGIKYANESAACIKFIYGFNHGHKRSAAISKLNGQGSGKLKVTPISSSEAKDFISSNPFFFKFIESSMSVWLAGDKTIPFSIFSGLLWCIDQINPVKSWEYFTKLSTGVDIKEGSPIHYVRKKILESRLNEKKIISKGDQVALIVKAFNYYVDGADSVVRIVIPKNVPFIIPAKKAAI